MDDFLNSFMHKFVIEPFTCLKSVWIFVAATGINGQKYIIV